VSSRFLLLSAARICEAHWFIPPGVRSARRNRLVGLETVPTNLNLLREPERATAHDNVTFISRWHFTLLQLCFTYVRSPFASL